MDKELKKVIDEEVRRIMLENGMQEDMLGYQKLYEEIKRNLALEKYNILLEKKTQNGVSID